MKAGNLKTHFALKCPPACLWRLASIRPALFAYPRVHLARRPLHRAVFASRPNLDTPKNPPFAQTA